MIHPATGFTIGDPEKNPLAKIPTQEEVKAFLDSLILSISGWRGVFGKFDEDTSDVISPEKAYVVAKMAIVFGNLVKTAKSLSETNNQQKPVIALGIDSRPTGPAIADIITRVFVAQDIDVKYAFICSAPEIMAWVHRSGKLPETNPDHLDAFCYVSASHNPKGHNGIKFGLNDGAVLASLLANELKSRLLENIGNDIAEVAALVANTNTKQVAHIYSECTQSKRKAISDYMLFSREVSGCSEILEEQEKVLDELAKQATERDASIIADFNGSSRILSIDEDYLASLGVNLIKINDKIGVFSHKIVPEGQSLETCRKALEEQHKKDPGIILGYVPDCDGDRGNIVFWDDDLGCARALEAQDTFSLAVLSELCSLSRSAFYSGKTQKLAVACNDATSLRINAIAGVFGAEVFRCETGEPNVVGLARILRDMGYTVRILGEGSNGGVITYPASVRDPMNTLSAILKLLFIRRSNDGMPGLYEYWLEQSGQKDQYHDEFCLCDILASLPKFSTTSVFEDRAALKIGNADKVELKNKYEQLFIKEWDIFSKKLTSSFGLLRWKAYSSNGTLEQPLAKFIGDRGTPHFGDSNTGGLKIIFYDDNDIATGFLWMRASGTEPVFRIMADIRSDKREMEQLLLNFHSDLVKKAAGL